MPRRKVLILCGWLVLASLSARDASHAQPYAYVAGFTSGTISVLDTRSLSVVATLVEQGPGSHPYAAAATPDGRHVLVTYTLSNQELVVLDTAQNTVVSRSGGATSFGAAVSPDGGLAYVLEHFPPSVAVLETAGFSRLGNIPISCPGVPNSAPLGVAFTPDGRKAYVVGGCISVIDTTTGTVIETLAVPRDDAAFAVAVTPDGTKAYIAFGGRSQVQVLDTATDSILTTIATPSDGTAVAVTPDGTKAYVANRLAASVTVIDTATDSVLRHVTVGRLPWAIAIAPDGSRAFVANRLDHTVSVIDPATDAVLAAVPVGQGPTGIAIAPCKLVLAAGTTAFGADGGQGEVAVTAGGGCPWTASSDSPWLTITSGTGGRASGRVRFAVAPNQGPVSRRGVLTIGGQEVVVTQSASDRCPSGRTISNVLLPEIVVPVQGGHKPWSLRYGALGLDFQVLGPGPGTDILCRATTASGTLEVFMQFPALEREILVARSVAGASLTVHAPHSVPFLPTCAFFQGGPFANDCVLFGAFDPNAHYAEWHTEGFTTVILGAEPGVTQTGPLTFWVNLEQLGLSPARDSMEILVRAVEPVIHQELVGSLPVIARYARIQDPGHVRLSVTAADGATTGSLPDGSILARIPRSFYIESESQPAVLLADFAEGVYNVVVTGISTGEFDLAAAVAELPGRVMDTEIQGRIDAGVSLVYQVTLARIAEGSRPLFTFDAEASLDLLIRYLESLALEPGLAQSLKVKLGNAQASLGRGGNRHDAAARLEAFAQEVRAQRGKRLEIETADRLAAWADAVRERLVGHD